MYNKNTYRKTNDKKLLHKIGKRWVTVSIAMLALLGGSFAMKSVTTHADTITPAVEAQNTNHVKKQLNSGFARAYQANKSASANGAKSVASSSAPSSATRTNNIQSQAGRMYRGLMLNATKNPQKQSGSTTNSNVASSGSSKVNQPSSVSASSNSVSGNGMNTLDLGNASQQARGWNFVQHGIRNNDYASVNNSGSSSVNNSASGNQTASESSTNAKSDTASAPINQTNQNSLNSLNAKLKAMEPSTNASNATAKKVSSNNDATKKPLLKSQDNGQSTMSDGHWIYNPTDNKYYGSDIAHFTQTGSAGGLNYKYDPQLNALEYTSGVAEPDMSKFMSVRLLNQGEAWMFNGPTQTKEAQSIKFANNIDTSHVTNMNDFISDTNAVSIDLGNNFDTGHVTNMNQMFNDNSQLSSLYLGNKFDTSNVSDMSYMFSNNSALQALNLGTHFNTSHVTNMNNMFGTDPTLTNLNLGNKFDTSNVTNMNSMFCEDSALQSLNLGKNFDTSSVTDMSNMFGTVGEINQLNQLDLGDKFSIQKVTNMSDMFMSAHIGKLIFPKTFDTTDTYNKPYTHTGYWGNQVTSDAQKNALEYASINEIIINSNNTKFDNASHFPKLYKELSQKDNKNKNYTLSTPNDFNKGNLGTFISENPKPVTDTINYQDGNTTKSSYTINGYFGDSNKLTNIPNGYELSNPSQSTITLNGSNHNIAIKKIINDWDTISYEYQPNSNQNNYYEVINQGQAYGRQGSNYNIQSSDVPKGYQLVNPNDNKFKFGDSNGFHRIMIKPTTSSDIPAIPNTVNIKGTVDLHFTDGSKTRDIKLDYLTQDSDDKQINLLNDVDYSNGSNMKPSDFVKDNTNIQGFDVSNFTYKEATNNDDGTQYMPSKSDTDYNHGSTNLLVKNITLNFNAKNNTDPIQNGSTSTIEYIDNGKIISSNPVNSSTGSKIDPSSYVPKGYHVASDNNGQKSFTNDGSTHNVEVVGNTVPDTSITVKQSNGTTAQIPVKGHKIGDKITINPGQYAPKGYSPDSNDNPITVTIVPSNNQSGYSFQPSGNDTDPNATNNVFKGNTVSYNYHYDPDKAGNTVTVKYRNHAGKIVGTKTYNVPKGTKINPNDNVPSDYTNDGTNNSPITAPSDGKPSTYTYNVKGTKSASQLPSSTNQGKVELHIVEKSNGNQVNSYNVQVDEGSKLVGSDFTIDPSQSTDVNVNKLVPKGYAPDSTDKTITGVITDNGAITDSGTDTLIYDAQGKNGCNIHYQNPSNPNDTSKDIVVPTNNDKTGQHLTNADVPNGYHLPSDTSFSFNSDGYIINDKTGQQLPNNRVPLEGNDIQGKANIVLQYQILDPTGKNVVKTIYNNADDAQVILNGQVGGSQTINPWRYWKKDFTIPSGVANQSDTIHFTPSDDNANDENGQQFNPTLTYTATAQQAGDIGVQYVDMDNIDPVTKKPTQIGNTQDIKNSDLGNLLVGQKAVLGQKEPSDNDTNINNDSDVKYVLNVPKGYHLEHNANPVIMGVAQTKPGLGAMPRLLFSLGQSFHRPVGLFLTVGLSRPVTPNKPKSSASVSSSSSASVKPSSATSVTPSSASSSSSSANSSTSVTSSGNTYISNISYISYVTNNYSSSANTSTSYASSSTATPVITPVVNPIVTPTVNPASESTHTTNVESASAKPTEVVNNDNDNNTTYNINGSEADKLIQHIPVGAKMYHKKVSVKRLSQKKLGMYYIMVTRPTWIYRGTRFTRRNRIRVIKPKDIIAVPIQRIFRINGRMVFQIRIHVSRHHNSAFITGNHRYVRNAYIQPKELRGHHYVRVLRNAELYRSPRYSNRTRVGNVYRGAKLRVKRIRYIASKHMTRIQLTNGRWFTANKNFVKIIK